MTTRFATILVLAACSGKATPPPSTPTSPPPTTGSAGAPPTVATPPPEPSKIAAQKMSLREVGLEPGSLDRTADPCVDFYQFACGGWLAANKLPEDRARYARFTEIDDKNNAELRALLEDDAKGTNPDPNAKKLGDFYAACMDEAAIEKAGTTAIKPMLDTIGKVKDNKSWLTAVIELHKAGADVVFREGSTADFHDSINEITELDTGGLGLPDRDYYLEAKFKPQLEGYQGHVGKMLALSGGKAEGAADVVAIETEIAKLTKTRVERRDPKGGYNPTDVASLGKQVKSIDLKSYFKSLGFVPSAKINVTTPKFFTGLDALRAKFKPAQWASYFRYHLVEGTAFELGKMFDAESFELKKLLTGQAQQQERAKRCVDATERGLGELLGQQYVAKYFPASAKQTATKLVDTIIAVMGEDIAQLDWMSDATKTTAAAKLAKIVRKIGYPDTWRVYDFDIKRGDFAGNDLRAAAFETHRQLNKSGKPVDRAEWGMNSYTVNAYYEPTENNTALPAGILQAPFFGADRGVAANLGGIGMVIGHELTHGFDDEGSQFDADGNLKMWWQADDKTKFDAKATCVADQYSTFEALPQGFVNGRLTLGEDIADLGGVKMAFRAYRSLRKGATPIEADGFSEDQQFFLAVGQAWCSKDRPAEVQRRLTVDPHAPPKFRVYGALRNLPEFATAFSCSAGTPMKPAQACTIW